MGSAGRIVLADEDSVNNDMLLYTGTAGDDTFTVSDVTNGVVVLNSRIGIDASDLVALTLDGFGGDDSFTVDPSVDFEAGIRLRGGESDSPGDRVQIDANGTANVTLDFDNSGATTIAGIVGGGNDATDLITLVGPTTWTFPITARPRMCNV
jgi:hypothetical protein